MKKSFRKSKKLSTNVILLIITGVCVVAIFVGLLFNFSGGPLNAVAGVVFIPMQKGINGTGQWLFGQVNEFQTVSALSKENEELQAQVDALTEELTTIKLERYELENYRALYDLDEKYPNYDKVAASVIAMDGSNWFYKFTVNKGSKDGVAVGMNVLGGGGLVGIVTDVGPHYAEIRSVIDDSNKVSCMVTTTMDNIIVSGDLKSVNSKGVIKFTDLKDDKDQVALGDPVVTSYVSDQYHQGILVGYITSIEKDSNNLTKSGTITPVVDFEHIQEVLIITELKDTGSDIEE